VTAAPSAVSVSQPTARDELKKNETERSVPHSAVGGNIVKLPPALAASFLERECTEVGWVAHAFCMRCSSRILEVACQLCGFVEGC